MPTLSDHTSLLNVLIALGHRTPDLKHPLEDHGYTLDRIGMKIDFPDGELNPDITFKSHARNRLLIIEAKSGGINNEQAKRYKALTPDHISRLGLTTLPATNLTTQVCYACLSKNIDKVLDNEQRHQHGFPIIVFSGSTLRKVEQSESFDDPELQQLFSDGVTFDCEPSYFNYPFGPDDTKGWIAYCVLSKLAEFWAREKKRFTEIDLMRECHPLIEYLGKKEQKIIHRVVHGVLEEVNDNDLPRLTIKKHKNQEWEIITFIFTKINAKSLMDMATRFDTKPDYDDLEKWASP